jgi:predicted metal-dependent peptidase
MDKVQSLSKTAKELMLIEPYYGFFLIMLNKTWRQDLPTAGVSKNGINYQLAINEEFWESLSEEHQLGLLKHELLHMIEDYEDLDLDTKAGCRYYYKKLQELQQEKDKNGTCGNEPMDKLLDDIENGDVPDHSTWEEFDDLSEAEKKLIDRQIQKVLSDAKEQTVKKRGRIPGEIEGVITIEEIVAPKFDWRGYMRRFTGVSTKVFTKKIRRKENRKFPESPGLKLKMKQHMLLGIDTSGSVSDSELQEFMSEIHHIYKAGVDVTIIQCDASIRSIDPYNGKHELEVQGRGGTEFDPVLEYYNENQKKYTSLVYFTDGECYTSVKPKGHVLWVLSERSQMNEELPGKVIKLEL